MQVETAPETLRRLRGKRTQGEVAKAIGIAVSSVSAYENGDRVPRDEVKKRFADFYGKTVQYIFFR